MKRLGFVFVAAVLTLVTLLPMATSADPGGTQSVPHAGRPAITQNAADNPDPEEMEEFRRDLLDLVDALEVLYPYAEAYAQVTDEPPPPLVSRHLIRTLTYKQLAIVQDTFGDAYVPFKQDIKALKSLVLSPQKERGEIQEPGNSVLGTKSELNAVSSAPPSSSKLIPAPTPVTVPPPGITHANHGNTNDTLGDLPDPNYPTSVGCPDTRFPNAATLTTLIATAIAKEVDDFADAAGCEGTFFVVAAPFGGGSNLPGCLGWAVLKVITLAASAVDEGLNFCIGRIDAAELEAARVNATILHAELAMHDVNLTNRFNTTDQFLFHFRNVNLRSRIEANLASEEDDPIAEFYLPRQFCITNALETLTNPNSSDYDPFAHEAIAGCGLLEVVSDTVKSAMDMTTNASEDINNAESEFNAAVQHYDDREWKLAYDRFRKAYREVIKP
ncbi:MAG: hypothetical protein MAG451_01972 [Anaerolineales bacterium]|nr:hypothetical protein [Anaerolineales bacterium]